MFIIDDINITFIRLFLIVLLAYGLHKLFNKKPLLFSDFIVYKVGAYSAMCLVLVYILILLNAYNVFNMLLIFTAFVIIDYFKFSSPKKLMRYAKKAETSSLINSVAFAQNNNKSFVVKEYLKTKRLTKNETLDFVIVCVLLLSVYLSRFFFYKKDMYLFSESWFEDLSTLQDISNQNWFSKFYTEIGEFALIDVTSKFLKLSPAITLQFFGIVQTCFIAITLFWITKNIFKFKESIFFFLLPSFLFVLANAISPVNIDYVLKHHLVYSVLFFVLPSFLILVNQQHFRLNFKRKIIYFNLVLIASFLVNFSVVLLIVVPFLLIILFGNYIKSISEKVIIISSFITCGLLVLLSYYIFYPYGNFDAIFFLKSSFIKVNEYSSVSHMVVDYGNIIKGMFFIGFLGLIGTLYTSKTNKPIQIFTLLYQLLALLFFLPINVIDKDVLLLLFNVLTPLVFTINVFQFVLLLRIKEPKKLMYLNVISTVLLVCFLMYDQSFFYKNASNTNQTNREILTAYNAISQSHLPYTYAVVSNDNTQVFSNNYHYFISYEHFTNTHLVKDSIYFKNEKDVTFFKKHPEAVLSSKIFVFEISEIDKEVNRKGFTTSEIDKENTSKLITTLKNRGRKVSLFSESPRLKVYEITNKENSSKIADVFF